MVILSHEQMDSGLQFIDGRADYLSYDDALTNILMLTTDYNPRSKGDPDVWGQDIPIDKASELKRRIGNILSMVYFYDLESTYTPVSEEQ